MATFNLGSIYSELSLDLSKFNANIEQAIAKVQVLEDRLKNLTAHVKVTIETEQIGKVVETARKQAVAAAPMQAQVESTSAAILTLQQRLDALRMPTALEAGLARLKAEAGAIAMPTQLEAGLQRLSQQADAAVGPMDRLKQALAEMAGGSRNDLARLGQSFSAMQRQMMETGGTANELRVRLPAMLREFTQEANRAAIAAGSLPTQLEAGMARLKSSTGGAIKDFDAVTNATKRLEAAVKEVAQAVPAAAQSIAQPFMRLRTDLSLTGGIVANLQDRLKGMSAEGRAGLDKMGASLMRTQELWGRTGASANEYRQRIGGVIAETNRLDNATKTLQQNMQRLGAAGTNFAQFGAQLPGLSQKFQQANAAVMALRHSVQNTGQAIGTMATEGSGKVLTFMGVIQKLRFMFINVAMAVIALRTAFRIFEEFIGPAARFEQEMSKLRATFAATGGVGVEAFSFLQKKILELGGTTEWSAEQVSKGAREMVKAGLGVGDVYTLLPSLLKFATVAEIDLAEAAKVATTAMSAFRMQAEEVPAIMDKITFAAMATKADVKDIAEAFKSVAAPAALMKQSLDSVIAGVATLTQLGVPGAMAGRQMGRMLQDLSKLAIGAGTELQKATIAALKIDPKMLDPTKHTIGEIIKLLREKGATVQHLSILLETFGFRSAAALTLLHDKFIEVSEGVKNANGTVNEMHRIWSDNLLTAVQRLKNAFDALLIHQGSGGVLGFFRNLVDTLRLYIEYLNGTLGPSDKFYEKAKKMQEVVDFVAAALAGVATAILVSLLPAIWSLVAGVTAATGGLNLLLGAAAALGVAKWRRMEGAAAEQEALNKQLDNSKNGIDELTKKYDNLTKAGETYTKTISDPKATPKDIQLVTKNLDEAELGFKSLRDTSKKNVADIDAQIGSVNKELEDLGKKSFLGKVWEESFPKIDALKKKLADLEQAKVLQAPAVAVAEAATFVPRKKPGEEVTPGALPDPEAAKKAREADKAEREALKLAQEELQTYLEERKISEQAIASIQKVEIQNLQHEAQLTGDNSALIERQRQMAMERNALAQQTMAGEIGRLQAMIPLAAAVSELEKARVENRIKDLGNQQNLLVLQREEITNEYRLKQIQDDKKKILQDADRFRETMLDKMDHEIDLMKQGMGFEEQRLKLLMVPEKAAALKMLDLEDQMLQRQEARLKKELELELSKLQQLKDVDQLGKAEAIEADKRIREINQRLELLGQERAVGIPQKRETVEKKEQTEWVTGMATAFTDATRGMVDALMKGGKGITDVIKNLGQSMMEHALKPLFDQVEESMKQLFKGISEKFGATGQMVMGLIGAAIVGLSSFFGKKAAETEALGEKTKENIESAEKQRGLIAGESTIAIQKLSENLSSAFRPTNEILLRIEQILRATAGGSVNVSLPAAPQAGLGGDFSFSVMGTSRV